MPGGKFHGSRFAEPLRHSHFIDNKT